MQKTTNRLIFFFIINISICKMILQVEYLYLSNIKKNSEEQLISSVDDPKTFICFFLYLLKKIQKIQVY